MLNNRNELNYQGQDVYDLIYESRIRKNREAFVGYSFGNDMVKNIFSNDVSRLLKKWDFHYTEQDVGSTQMSEPIITQIVAKIDRSRFCIMDLTDHRHNVYFEAGIVFGRRIDLILTCHSEDQDNLAFDTKQYEVIIWNDEDIGDFMDKLDRKLRVNLPK